MRTKDLTCHHCKRTFKKQYAEFKRQWREGHRRFYCTQSCQVSLRNKISPHGNPQYLVPDNKRDTLTPFRWFAARARQRTRTRRKNGEAPIIAKELKALWDSQGGICPITGWKLILPHGTAGWTDGKNPNNASLDRIDGSKGYEKNNVRFLALIANLARADFSDEDVVRFCRDVYHRTK